MRISTKYYVIICSLALIVVMGLRDRYTGSMDTYMYTTVFAGAQNYASLPSYLQQMGIFDGPLIFSEAGFFVFTWLAAQILPNPQWFLLLTAFVIISLTAKFILENSEDPAISWITFICLGSFSFAMNGMRQALAMSICLISYRYVREKKLIPFLLIILLAVLFHKSAIIFALVYLMRNMKLNVKSFAFIAAGFVFFIAIANRLAFIFDSLTGEDYSEAESFESGGVVNVLIYLIA
ncbi:MAG: EpsG family protein, partial [Clostridia bacterium]|nr:EpsG family protein [Clostridia bacterium]